MGEAVSNQFGDRRHRRFSLKKIHVAGLMGLFAFVLVSCSTAAPTTQPAPAEPILDIAPDFELTLFGNANHQAGEPLKMSDLAGRPVVVNFWFPACPPCEEEMPGLQASFERHNGDVEFVGVQLVGLDSAADGQDFVDDFGLTFSLGPDEGTILRDYNVSGFPTTVFVGEDQRIVRKWTGFITEEKLEEIITEILN